MDSSEKKTYLDPEEVLTTLPLVAPFGTGEVVTTSPSLKFGDPEIFPEIDPLLFWRQSEITGTPWGGDAFFATGGAFGALGALVPRNPPNRSPRDTV